MKLAKDYSRVVIVLMIAIFLILFLIVNSPEFRDAGYIFLAMAGIGLTIYFRGKIL